MSHLTKQSFLQYFFLDTWYKKRWWAWLLLPLSWLYQLLSYLYSLKEKRQSVNMPVPVVVIGNISVGGTGKTPVIIALANTLSEKGVSVGIVSRGYGSLAPYYPYIVTAYGGDASIAGDEPLLIAQATHCPVAIDKNRVIAAQHLLAEFPEIDIILSDDGLQHYRLERDFEVAVIDGKRGLGNHFCLPAGPLREPASRLASVDWVLSNQDEKPVLDSESGSSNRLMPIYLQPKAWRHIASDTTYPLQPFPWLDGLKRDSVDIKAVAGIGHPQRFFKTLKDLKIDGEHHAFNDHYEFSSDDFLNWKDVVVLMTEKDAVKCRSFVNQQSWSLIVDVALPDAFVDQIAQLIKPLPKK